MALDRCSYNIGQIKATASLLKNVVESLEQINRTLNTGIYWSSGASKAYETEVQKLSCRVESEIERQQKLVTSLEMVTETYGIGKKQRKDAAEALSTDNIFSNGRRGGGFR